MSTTGRGDADHRREETRAARRPHTPRRAALLLALALVLAAGAANAQSSPATEAPALVTFSWPGETAILEQRQGSGWRPLCEAPCRLALDPRATYRVAGPGMRASTDFRLESGPSRIDVRPAAPWLRPTGAAVTAVGVATVAVGAFVIGSTLCSDPHSDECGSSSVRGVGATILSLGGIALFAGIMTLMRGGTDVVFVRDPTASSWGPAGLTF